MKCFGGDTLACKYPIFSLKLYYSFQLSLVDHYSQVLFSSCDFLSSFIPSILIGILLLKKKSLSLLPLLFTYSFIKSLFVIVGTRGYLFFVLLLFVPQIGAAFAIGSS